MIPLLALKFYTIVALLFQLIGDLDDKISRMCQFIVTGSLYPVNERATRTIRNLYIENERVCRLNFITCVVAVESFVS